MGAQAQHSDLLGISLSFFHIQIHFGVDLFSITFIIIIHIQNIRGEILGTIFFIYRRVLGFGIFGC